MDEIIHTFQKLPIVFKYIIFWIIYVVFFVCITTVIVMFLYSERRRGNLPKTAMPLI